MDKNPNDKSSSPSSEDTPCSSSSFRSLSAVRPQSFRIFTRLPVKVDDFGLQEQCIEKRLPQLDESEISGLWKQAMQPEKQCLGSLLKKRIQDNCKPNIHIKIGYFTFHCHLVVLQCYSNYFMKIDKLRKSTIKLPQDKVAFEAFAKIYSWMLADEPFVECLGIVEVFGAAMYLGIDELLQQCWQCFENSNFFYAETAYDAFCRAKKMDIALVQNLMLGRIGKFFLVLVASKDFQTLTAKELCTLLQSSNVGVNSEVEIFLSVLIWLGFDESDRKKHLLEIMNCVRFALMPHWFFTSYQTILETPLVDHIINNPEALQLVDNGIKYKAACTGLCEDNEIFKRVVTHYKLKSPIDREWIFDTTCAFHHRPECPNQKGFSFETFKKYLQKIHSAGIQYWRNFEYLALTKNNCCICAKCAKSAK